MLKQYTIIKAISLLSMIVFFQNSGQAQASTEGWHEAWKMNSSTNAVKEDKSTSPPFDTTYTDIGYLYGVQNLCYTADSIYIEAEGLADTVGDYFNPGDVYGQSWMFALPRNPSMAVSLDEAPTVSTIGVLVNGVVIYGRGDGSSYNNQGFWNGDAYYNEGFTLDDRLTAHGGPGNVYHTHATPYKLYDSFSTSEHSPIVGFAWDGYPIYGPYGYIDSLNELSGVKRMETSYKLRDITVRTNYANGQGVPPGPTVAEEELGAYVEDYEFVQGFGTLDEHNGRWCVTPEYPAGTYAYFVTQDIAGSPEFPFFVGETYYGSANLENSTPSIAQIAEVPGSATCVTSNLITNVLVDREFVDFEIYPNPATEKITIVSDQTLEQVSIYDPTGIELRVALEGESIDVSSYTPGCYILRVKIGEGMYSKQFIVK